jgi:glutamyl-tRNA synthetase
MPTYHLSVVADDIEMKISHVIRGADHLSNTSKHVLLFEALGAKVPKFAHLPLIFGPDKKRLSKRHGATSVTEYEKMGFLPEAVRNYLALLGWSPGDDSEFFSGEELISRFDPTRINKANAIFDISKLEWMNKRYLSSIKLETLVPEIRKRLVQEHLWYEGFEKGKREWFYRVLDLLRARAASLDDIVSSGRAFFTDDFEYEEEALRKYSGTEDPDLRSTLREALVELKNSLASIEPFDESTTEVVLRSIGDKFALKTGLFIGAVRVATTGMGRAPGIFEVLIALGRDKSVDRLDKFIRILQ